MKIKRLFFRLKLQKSFRLKFFHFEKRKDSLEKMITLGFQGTHYAKKSTQSARLTVVKNSRGVILSKNILFFKWNRIKITSWKVKIRWFRNYRQQFPEGESRQPKIHQCTYCIFRMKTIHRTGWFVDQTTIQLA